VKGWIGAEGRIGCPSFLWVPPPVTPRAGPSDKPRQSGTAFSSSTWWTTLNWCQLIGPWPWPTHRSAPPLSAKHAARRQRSLDRCPGAGAKCCLGDGQHAGVQQGGGACAGQLAPLIPIQLSLGIHAIVQSWKRSPMPLPSISSLTRMLLQWTRQRTRPCGSV
jgi:hypothetical protein